MEHIVDLSKFLKERTGRDVKCLFLNFLYILEDLEDKGKITEEEFISLRKRVLDYGNNTIRNLQEQIDCFDLGLKANDNGIQQRQKKEETNFNR